MVKRNIIKIEKSLCNGCGLCIDACTESALEMRDGFAYLSDESYCDGYGACISECQPNALKIEEREAKPFDPETASVHRKEKGKEGDTGRNVNWPLKLGMVSADAPFFKNSNLYIVSDCVPFAMKNFQQTILKNNFSILVSCPKFDEIESYRDKLGEIIEKSTPKSVTVVHMEIPCCQDIFKFVESVIGERGIPLHRIIIGTKGAVRLIY